MDQQALGNIYQQVSKKMSEKSYEEAIYLLQMIKKDNVANFQYAESLFILAGIYEKLEKLKEAKSTYLSISSEDDPQFYAWSQLILYDLEKDVKYLKNIKKEYDETAYIKAVIQLGNLEKSLEKKYNYWKFIPDKVEYSIENYKLSLIRKILNLDDTLIQNSLYGIFEKTHYLLACLFVNSNFEKFIAHYTSLAVAKKILDSGSEDNKNSSKLRLNTINLMNDPTEGLCIDDVISFSCKTSIKDNHVAFLSCFTLHHDSLNQFRLYGKEKDKEATGASLILNKSFFGESNIARLFKKNISTAYYASIFFSEINKLAEIPLYRCIYLDPTSGLIKLAQREEWSFHREYKAENKKHQLEPNLIAEELWEEYSKEVSKLEIEVTKGLKELREQIETLNQPNLKPNHDEVLAEILLPLRYLIKHMAFKEEQECRLIYITQMDNPLIKYDEKINRIYIDYEPSVMEHLEKIYLAPKAKDEQMVFEYLCSRGQKFRKGKPPVKVKISQNPFR